MTDNGASPGAPSLHELSALLSELEAGTQALDAAFHFDDRAAVKPAYDRLMRLRRTHRELLHRFGGIAPADAAGDSRTATTIAAIAAVLGELSAGIERYHDLAGPLARLRSQLATAIARAGP
ncbi:hypothetical protein K4L06_20570 [Lysobacter sp. BMK333-48F3]|uniref:hypothetical protein n=1 Tax=Lysobacter sp. BMK333-48F3 TaxID=2867962 RepID=UPI001C8BD117|nr:hypothetical protein [Lysobacter sp. BMK333-48F3]MBX9403708.1 hypothetical protein [Lysobacter sp. BMK333-48F3]